MKLKRLFCLPLILSFGLNACSTSDSNASSSYVFDPNYHIKYFNPNWGDEETFKIILKDFYKDIYVERDQKMCQGFLTDYHIEDFYILRFFGIYHGSYVFSVRMLGLGHYNKVFYNFDGIEISLIANDYGPLVWNDGSVCTFYEAKEKELLNYDDFLLLQSLGPEGIK